MLIIQTANPSHTIKLILTHWQFDILTMLLTFAVALCLEYYILPKILLISKKKHLFDEPESRKEHTIATPRLAGVTFIPILLFSFLSVFAFRVWYITKGQFLLGVPEEYMNTVYPHVRNLLYFVKELCMLICGMIILLLLGVKDDLIGVKSSTKFVIQFVAALCFTLGGVFFSKTYGLFGVDYLPYFVSVPFSIFIIMLITNSINLIDGIDGLASGLSMVAVSTLGISFLQRGFIFQAMLSFAALGVLLPFFYTNVFKPQERKLFMGDTGSLALGFLLGYLTIRHSTIQSESIFMGRPLLFPISVLFIPAFDVACVMITRKIQKKPLFQPDRSHIHHKLIDAGMSRRMAMGTIVSFSFVILLANVVMSLVLNINIIVAIDVVICLMCNILLSKKLKRLAIAK